MKKSILITSLVLLAQTSLAQVSSPVLTLCKPWVSPPVNVNPSLIKPVQVEELLKKMRSELSERQLEEMMGTPVLRSLDMYTKVPADGINANAYVAAAAAGAAVAVVEYVWDRYVGNGSKNRGLIRENAFDLQQVRPVYPSPSIPQYGMQPQYGSVQPKFQGFAPKDYGFQPKYDGFQPKYEGAFPKHGGIDPVALTPAVAAATVGALAYKAAEYSMKKAFGEMGVDPYVDINSFDLQQNTQISY